MELKTAEQHNAQHTGIHRFTPNVPKRPNDPKADNVKNHLPAAAPHPLRCSINGDMHLIPELKKLIEASNIPIRLKEFLAEELDKMKSNGAEVHLHLLDHSNGDGSLSIHWKAVHLGSKAGR